MLTIFIILSISLFIVFWLIGQGFFSFRAQVIKCSKGQILKHDRLHLKLFQGENELRRKAYSRSAMELNETFFDDSDMLSEYFLLVIYHKRTNQVLLSARYYSDSEKIKKTIIGEVNETSYLNDQKINNALLTSNIIFIDRMSANVQNATFRKFRDIIHLMFYVKIYKENKNKFVCAMARSTQKETLIFKYADWGLNIIGKTKHNGVDHWVMLGDFKTSFKKVKNSFWYNSLFILKLIEK